MARRRWSLLFAVLVGGCALPSAMPPLSRDLVQLAPMTEPPQPANQSRTPISPKKSPVVREYDDTLDLSLFSVTTHKGKYFLWMQDPRLTFFMVSPGRAINSLPAVVYLIFRTQTPQEVADSRLQLTCDGGTTLTDVVPRAKVVPGMLTSSVYQTFELPTDSFRHFAACQSGSVTVGGVEAPFNAEQFGKLRALAAELPAS